MPRKKNITSKSSINRLATPDELAKYEALQNEIKKLISTIHQPFFDIFSLTIIPWLLGQLVLRLRDLDIYTLDIFANLYCETSSVISPVELTANDVAKLLKKNIPFESWPKYLPENKAGLIKNFFKTLHFCHAMDTKILLSATEKALIANEPIYQILYSNKDLLSNICSSIQRYKTLVDQTISTVRFQVNAISELSDANAKGLNYYTESIYALLLGTKQSCINLAVSTPLHIISLCSRPFLKNLFLTKFPFGIFYKHNIQKNLLLIEPHQIQVNLLHEKTNKLREIKNNIWIWEQRKLRFLWYIQIIAVIFFMGIMLNAFIKKDTLINEQSIFLLITQPFLTTYLMSSAIDWVRTKYQQYKIHKLIISNYYLLNLISKKLNLPTWNLIEEKSKELSFFELTINTATVLIDEQKISKKNLSFCLTQAFFNNNIQLKFYNSQEIVLPVNIALTSSQVNAITDETIFLIKCVTQLKADAIKLEQQMKAIASIVNTNYYKVTTSLVSTYGHDYIFNFNLKNKTEIAVLNIILQNMFDQNRLKIADNNDYYVIKLRCGIPAPNTIFEQQLVELKKIQFANIAEFDTSLNTQTPGVSASIISRLPKVKAKTCNTSNNTAVLIKNSVNVVINFGLFGTYNAENPNNIIKPINAPFWPIAKHFMLFDVPPEAFATENQYKKFMEIQPRIVNGKGAKGLVSSGKKYFFIAIYQ